MNSMVVAMDCFMFFTFFFLLFLTHPKIQHWYFHGTPCMVYHEATPWLQKQNFFLEDQLCWTSVLFDLFPHEDTISASYQFGIVSSLLSIWNCFIPSVGLRRQTWFFSPMVHRSPLSIMKFLQNFVPSYDYVQRFWILFWSFPVFAAGIQRILDFFFPKKKKFYDHVRIIFRCE